MADIWLLDDSLRVQVYFDREDCGWDDNICVSFREVASDDEKILRADETNIYLTPAQAQALGQALLAAVRQSQGHAASPDAAS